MYLMKQFGIILKIFQLQLPLFKTPLSTIFILLGITLLLCCAGLGADVRI